MFEKILVAFDGTDAGRQAFMVGLAIAKRFGGEIYVCSVIEHLVRQSFVLKGAVEDIIDHATKHFEFTRRPLLQRAEREGVKVTSHLMVGGAVEKLLQFAEKEHINVIVIGGIGEPHFLRWDSRSTGMQIASRAPCSVIVARELT